MALATADASGAVAKGVRRIHAGGTEPSSIERLQDIAIIVAGASEPVFGARQRIDYYFQYVAVLTKLGGFRRKRAENHHGTTTDTPLSGPPAKNPR